MKNKKQNIATLFLLVVFTFSSIGISYSAPCCDKVETPPECCIQESQQQENCCEDEIKKEKHICKNHCDGLCFTTYSYSKLDVDQISSSKTVHKTILTSTDIILDNIDSEHDEVLSNTNPNKSPPKSSGRNLIYSLNKPKIPYLIIV